MSLEFPQSLQLHPESIPQFGVPKAPIRCWSYSGGNLGPSMNVASQRLSSKSVRCPRCGTDIVVGRIAEFWYDAEYEFVLVCSNEECLRPFLLCGEWKITGKYQNDGTAEDVKTIPGVCPKSEENINLWKETSIPSEVVKAWIEGQECLGNGHYAAACVMFRATLQGLLRTMGDYDEEKTLGQNIHQTTSLPAHIKSITRSIKNIGNWYAHIDPRKESIGDSSRKDAENMSLLLDHVAERLFLEEHRIQKAMAVSDVSLIKSQRNRRLRKDKK